MSESFQIDLDDSPQSYSPFEISRESVQFSVGVPNSGPHLQIFRDNKNKKGFNKVLTINKSFKERSLTLYKLDNSGGTKRNFQFNKVYIFQNYNKRFSKKSILFFRIDEGVKKYEKYWVKSEAYEDEVKYIDKEFSLRELDGMKESDEKKLYWMEVEFMNPVDFRIFTRYMKSLHDFLGNKGNKKGRRRKIRSSMSSGSTSDYLIGEIQRDGIKDWNGTHFQEWLRKAIFVYRRHNQVSKRLQVDNKVLFNKFKQRIAKRASNEKTMFEIYDFINQLGNPEPVDNEFRMMKLLEDDIESRVSIMREIRPFLEFRALGDGSPDIDRFLTSKIQESGFKKYSHYFKVRDQGNKKLESNRILIMKKRADHFSKIQMNQVEETEGEEDDDENPKKKKGKGFVRGISNVPNLMSKVVKSEFTKKTGSRKHSFYDPLVLFTPEEDRKAWDIDSCVNDILCVLLFQENIKDHFEKLVGSYEDFQANNRSLEEFKKENSNIKWENINFDTHLESRDIKAVIQDYKSMFVYSKLRTDAIREYLGCYEGEDEREEIFGVFSEDCFFCV